MNLLDERRATFPQRGRFGKICATRLTSHSRLRENMKRLFAILFAGCCLIAVAACEQTTPAQYFARAVLNSNLLYGFADSGMQRQLASPSEKLTDAKTGASAPMKRAEVLKDKLDAVQSNFDKVKALSSNDDTKEMIKASLALYEFALPVYHTEYKALAAMYDSGAAAGKIAALEKSITDKYAAKFQALHGALITGGKAYAAKHGIKVSEVNPSLRRSGV